LRDRHAGRADGDCGDQRTGPCGRYCGGPGAQAEHDPEALAIFITTNAELANAVGVETKRLSAKNPVAKVSLSNNGLVILAGSVEEARELTNRIAPEHLTVDELSDLDWVRNAGSVFIGRWSPQPMGDYISGPNHTLPTGARPGCVAG